MGVPDGGSNLIVQFSGMSFGPCPTCFAFNGEIPAESIDLSRTDVITALQAPVTSDNLRRLVDVLSSASREDQRALRALLAESQGRSADQLADDIERVVPRFHKLADWIRDRENRIELATWLTVLTGVLAILLALRPSQQGVTPRQMEQIIHAVAPTVSAQPRPPKLPGRNEPCYCGSGRKYKRCHGASPERSSVGKLG
jgi:uncharacterized protein YecA (UPF0149 family)